MMTQEDEKDLEIIRATTPFMATMSHNGRIAYACGVIAATIDTYIQAGVPPEKLAAMVAMVLHKLTENLEKIISPPSEMEA
jgi:DNA-binding NarL/FixJ family response regulator